MNSVLLALVAVLPIAIGAAFASYAMRHVSTSAIEGMTRQPEIAPQLFTAMLIRFLTKNRRRFGIFRIGKQESMLTRMVILDCGE